MIKLERAVKNLLHFIEAFVFALYYGFPARRLKIIGVTGTDGKTTTVNFVYQALKRANKKVAMISTVYAKIGGKEFSTGLHTTTPTASKLQKYLNLARKTGEEYVVLEVTAHGIDQHRVDFIDFYIGVVTNITPEHILSKDKKNDYFGDFETYLKTKVQLLKRSKFAIINKDDESYKLIKKLLDKRRVFTYSIRQKADFVLDFDKIKTDFPDFVKENLTAGYAVLKLLGIKESKIFSAIENFKLPPGRLEIVYKNGFKVIIDFAHTINSFKKVLPYVKAKYCGREGRLIHVFGAAGLRDYTKRRKMGRISGMYADVVILTEEDFRTEDPKKICRDIAKGLEEERFKKASFDFLKREHTKVYHIEISREKAIEKALKIVKKGDVVLLTGKGHEQSLARGKSEYPWNEKQVVLKKLTELGYVRGKR